MSENYSIRRGDNLSTLARRFGTTVDKLAKANDIKNPDHIIAGKKLKLPTDGFEAKGTHAPAHAPKGNDGFDTSKPQTQTAPQQTQTAPQQTQTAPQQPASTTTTPARADNATWRDETTKKDYPSRNGVPMYGQGDVQWGKEGLGTGGKTISRAGCAITACSMAVSKMSGKTFTPGEMDQYLDKHRGYSGDSVKFGQVGDAAQSNPPVRSERRHGLGMGEMDKELAAGRPVVIGVDYKNGKGTDHWMTVTGKNADGSYNVNDPAGGPDHKGRMIRMEVKNGTLQSADKNSMGSGGRPYHFDGNAVTFSGGNPKGGPQTPGTSTTTSTQQTPQPAQTSSTTPVNTSDAKTHGNDLTGGWKSKPGMDPNKYDNLIRDSSTRHGVPPRLLKAMMQQESHFDPNAKSGVGAQGLVQIMPGTWKDLGGGNPRDPQTNIDHAAKYMGQLLKRYHGDQAKALAAYNWGMGHVDKVAPKGQSLPMDKLPAETRNYVNNITHSYNGTSYK